MHNQKFKSLILLQVYVGNALCGEVQYEADKSIYEIPCHDVVGKSVKVELNNEVLTLCEVKVFGGKHYIRFIIKKLVLVFGTGQFIPRKFI